MSETSSHPLRLAPSILAADHSCLAEGLEVVSSLPLKWLHLDVMDGHFVPNLSFGPQTVADLRKRNSDLFFDTHLMLANPDKHVDAFMEAGSDLVSIHIEPDYDVAGTLERIRAAGAGIPAFYTPTGVGTKVAEGKETRQFDGRDFLLERALHADFAFVKAYQADAAGNLVYRATTRNFNPMMATAGKRTIAEVEEIVDNGALDPEAVVTPGIFVDQVVRGEIYEKRIEKRTYRA